MTAPHDIARALAFALGLTDNRITEQVDGLSAEGVLTGGQASEHDAVLVLLCGFAYENAKERLLTDQEIEWLVADVTMQSSSAEDLLFELVSDSEKTPSNNDSD